MARGKIQIKRIENTTNRQVTFSKRRKGLFNKANELSVLCDARVSILLFSPTFKIHSYVSSSTSTKEMLDDYQRTLGIDIWSSHYERMQKNLNRLNDENMNLRRQIRQRLGDCLHDLSFKELVDLEQHMEASLTVIRNRKNCVLTNQIGIFKKKVILVDNLFRERNANGLHRHLICEYGAEDVYPHNELDANRDYVIGSSDGVGGHDFALCLYPNQPNFQRGTEISELTSLTLSQQL